MVSNRKRVTRIEMEQRAQVIHKLFNDGYTPVEIAQALMKRFEVTERHAEVNRERNQTLSNTPPAELESDLFRKMMHQYRREVQKADGKPLDAACILEKAHGFVQKRSVTGVRHEERVDDNALSNGLSKFFDTLEATCRSEATE